MSCLDAGQGQGINSLIHLSMLNTSCICICSGWLTTALMSGISARVYRNLWYLIDKRSVHSLLWLQDFHTCCCYYPPMPENGCSTLWRSRLPHIRLLSLLYCQLRLTSSKLNGLKRPAGVTSVWAQRHQRSATFPSFSPKFWMLWWL